MGAARVSAWISPETEWDRKLEDLKGFVEHRQRLPAPLASSANERSLSMFIGSARRANLSSSHVQQLKDTHWMVADMVTLWESPIAFWHRRCAQLETFLQQHDRLPSTSDTSTLGRLLLVWFNGLRDHLHELSGEQIDALTSTHGLVRKKVLSWFDQSVAAWTRQYDRL